MFSGVAGIVSSCFSLLGLMVLVLIVLVSLVLELVLLFLVLVVLVLVVLVLLGLLMFDAKYVVDVAENVKRLKCQKKVTKWQSD